MKKFLIAICTLCSAVSAGAQAFTPDPITPPADISTTTMLANVTSQEWGYTVENEVEVGYVGSKVYIQGLIADFPSTWLEGDVSDDGTTLTFPQGQFIDFFGEEGYSYELYACGFTGNGSSLCDFVLVCDPTTGIMQSPSGMGIGEFMEYEGYYYNLDKLVNISISPITDGGSESVVFPDDVEAKTYYLEAEDFRNGLVEYEARLAVKDGEVYLGDFCDIANFSGAAIKGYYSSDDTVVFPSEQFLLRYDDEYDIYFYGASYDEETGLVTTGDLILDYDAATDTYHSRFTGILISIGKITTTEISFAEFLQNIVLLPAEDEVDGIASVLPHSLANLPVYTLDGRRTATGQGITIKGGRKHINR